jgi:hypothetical protein
LIDHPELHPGAGMLVAGGVPLGELFALDLAASTAIQAQLPGNGGVQHGG